MKYFKSLWAVVLASALTLPLAQSASADQQTINDALRAFNHKNYTKANQLIDKHLANNPNDSDAQYAKAMVLMKMGYYAKALQRLEKVLELSPKNHNAAMSYGAIVQQEVYRLINSNKNDEAIQVAEYGLDILPKYDQREFKVANANAYFAKGVAYFERWCRTNEPSDRETAFEAWNQTRLLEPTAATQQLLSGINAFLDSNFEGAKRFFQEGHSVRPKNRYINFWLGLSYAALGENDEALKELKGVSNLFRNNPLLHLYLGDIYKVKNQYPEAQAEYLKGLELRPNDSRIYTAIKNLMLCSNQIDEGISGYTNAVSENPDSYMAHYRLASFLHEAGRLDEALKAYEATAAMPGLSDLQKAAVNTERAIIYIEKNDNKKASQAVSTAELKLLQDSNSPRSRIYLAYTESDYAAKEKVIREVMKYSGPDSLWAHCEAFKAWADMEMARKQYLRAMEMTYQAWRRTAAGSPTLKTLSENFETCRQKEIKDILSEIRSSESLKGSDPFKHIEKVKTLNKQLDIVQKLSMGTPGLLLNQAQGAENIGESTIIPAELNANLPHTITTLVTPNSWINVIPDWQ